jgi:hypothetical protein
MKSTKLVKVTYSSKGDESSSLAKKLFGYRSWKVNIGGKEYAHKPIRGALESLGVQRIGRSRFIMNEKNLQRAKNEIEKIGGVVVQVEPVTMDEDEVERQARDTLRPFVNILIQKMSYASKASDKQMYVRAMDSGIDLTVSFEKYLDKLDDYGTSFVREELQRESELIETMNGLKLIAN